MITLESQGDEAWLVTVDSDTKTQHRVTVRAADIRRLGGGTFGAAELLEASFRFLLEREPNTSIMSSFDLSVIGRYFPEYEDQIESYLRKDAL